jgi:hypothetical protein
VRVALATCSWLPDLHEDCALLPPALRALGVETDVAVWDDPDVDWAAYDLVVVRSTWDYVPRRADYLAWAASVPRLANSAAVLAWNTDKTYLRDLVAAGIPVIPTAFVAPGEPYEAVGDVVVKPSVSYGALDTERFTDAADAAPLVARLHAEGRIAMVQPYVAGIDEAGETAVVVIEGEISHAARKKPLLSGEPASMDDPDLLSPREASAAERELALRVVAAVPEPLLYARVDLVPGPDGAPLLIELEATEPSLMLRQAPGSADRLARAVRARLG